MTELEPNERIVIEWPGYSGPTTVEWKLTPRSDGTFVSVTMKALLEHDVRLNLVADRYPGGHAEGACSR